MGGQSQKKYGRPLGRNGVCAWELLWAGRLRGAFSQSPGHTGGWFHEASLRDVGPASLPWLVVWLLSAGRGGGQSQDEGRRDPGQSPSLSLPAPQAHGASQTCLPGAWHLLQAASEAGASRGQCPARGPLLWTQPARGLSERSPVPTPTERAGPVGWAPGGWAGLQGTTEPLSPPVSWWCCRARWRWRCSAGATPRPWSARPPSSTTAAMRRAWCPARPAPPRPVRPSSPACPPCSTEAPCVSAHEAGCGPGAWPLGLTWASCPRSLSV